MAGLKCVVRILQYNSPEKCEAYKSRIKCDDNGPVHFGLSPFNYKLVFQGEVNSGYNDAETIERAAKKAKYDTKVDDICEVTLIEGPWSGNTKMYRKINFNQYQEL